MIKLDYHRPAEPKQEARLGFRIAAGFLLALAVPTATLFLLSAFTTGNAAYLGSAAVMLPGCYIFGRIAICGRL